METLISIIVPIYNSEKYLGKCIQSILEQSYPDFEVLLADDGSTDNSRAVCREICGADGRFSLLTLPHRGVSNARNEGMKAAKGKYLFFMDSDDEIHPGLLENLYLLAEKNHSVITGAEYLQTDGDVHWIIRKTGQASRYTCMDSEDALKCFVFEPDQIFFCAAGGKMILRESASAAAFSGELSNAEDTLFLYQMFLAGADIVVLHEKWYYYRRHEESASRTRSIKSYQDRYRVASYVCEQEKESGRLENAAKWKALNIWYIVGWRLKNYSRGEKELDRYFCHIMHEQKEDELFSHICLGTRAMLYFALYCFPLCRILFYLYKSWKNVRHGRDAGDFDYHSGL